MLGGFIGGGNDLSFSFSFFFFVFESVSFPFCLFGLLFILDLMMDWKRGGYMDEPVPVLLDDFPFVDETCISVN